MREIYQDTAQLVRYLPKVVYESVASGVVYNVMAAGADMMIP